MHVRQGKRESKAREKRKKNGIEAQRAKYPTPSRAIDALRGNEEQNGNNRYKRSGNEEKQRVTTFCILKVATGQYLE